MKMVQECATINLYKYDHEHDNNDEDEVYKGLYGDKNNILDHIKIAVSIVKMICRYHCWLFHFILVFEM